MIQDIQEVALATVIRQRETYATLLMIFLSSLLHNRTTESIIAIQHKTSKMDTFSFKERDVPVTDNLVTIRDLHYQRNHRVIFNGINIDIPRGKVIAIMGPSGTGKTTLLRLIGAQLRPQSGTIHINKKNVHQLSRRALYQIRSRMGMLFQSAALFTGMNVFENVAFPLREHTHLCEEMITDLVSMKLEMVGLRGAQHLMPSELSGGMVRRVALARALILDPELIMYDEPFTGLDPIALGVIAKLIRQLNDALGLTSIIVSHDVTETTRIADYVYVIAEGEVVGQGTPEEIQKDLSPYMVQFIQGLPDGAVPFHYPAKKYEEDLLS